MAKSKRGKLDDEHIETILSSGPSIIEDLLELAQASAAAPRLQVSPPGSEGSQFPPIEGGPVDH